MKPHIGYAILATFLYAIANVIIVRKIAHVTPYVNQLLWYIGGAIIALPLVLGSKHLKTEVTMPEPHLYPLIALGGIIFFLADYSFFRAYHEERNLMVITTIFILFPAFASMINAATGGGVPTMKQVGGWVLAAISVMLVTSE